MWDLSADKIISNSAQHQVVLYIIAPDIICYDYMSPAARELYNSLTPKQIETIKHKVKNMKQI